MTATQFRAEPDQRTGQVRYVVAGVGTFTIEPANHPTELADDPTRAKVTFGRPVSNWHTPWEILPDAPTLNRVTLVSEHTVNLTHFPPADLPGFRPLRAVADRNAALPAPVATSAEAWRIVRRLLADWLSRPDAEQLRAAHEEWMAQFRLGRSIELLSAVATAAAQAQTALDKAQTSHDRLHALMERFDARTGLS